VHNQHNLNNTSSNQILADFISDAKNIYSINKVGAATENAWFIENRIMTYNSSRSNSSEKFDVLVMEYEFWSAALAGPGGYYCYTYLTPNGYLCDNNGAFQFGISELQEMKNLADASSHPMTVEMYVGWPTFSQIQTISDIVDRTFVHTYLSDPIASFPYAETRLAHYSTYMSIADVAVIYSAEPNFSGPWLASNGMTQAEAIFMSGYNSSTASWKSNVNMTGFVYFAYTHMLCDIGESDFSGLVDSDEHHHLSSALNSSVQIISNSSVNYYSESEVILKEGFSVDLGCEFEAAIQLCN